jgi:LCP family protein required for cell wall assembly
MTRKTIKKIDFGIFGSIVIICLLIFGIYKSFASIQPQTILKIAGTELKKDLYGHTNFLLLGVGGEGHDGGDLTDSIIVASLDPDRKKVSLVSVPRDLYVEDSITGGQRINAIYFYAKQYFENDRKGIEHLKEKIQLLFGIPIHYWAKIDFKGFTELVDALDGITVTVEQDIYDQYYPKDGTILFEPFSIKAGIQKIDGATALKYARSRKTTSDFDRARRQQQIIYAIKDKALSTNVILDPQKINNIFDVLSDNISTDISVDEILTLGSMAGDFTEESISHRLIHDDPTQCNGLLYTPERYLYNNMFVLLVAGGSDIMHLYSDLHFNQNEVDPENTPLVILNGTKTPGVAGGQARILNRFCFDIYDVDNAKDRPVSQTTYYYRENRPVAIDFLQKIIPGVESSEPPMEYMNYFAEAKLVIELGSDYIEGQNYFSDPFLPLLSLYNNED